MRTMTATEISKNFKEVLDSFERDDDEIVVVRHYHLIARLVPCTPRMTAMEALGDLHN